MGIYMSVACKDVEIEEGFGNGVKYAVGEMQGWRKSMEDAHITYSTLDDQIGHDVNIPMSLFGVFDGHGGKEVAKFTKIKFAEILVQELAAKGSDIKGALKEAFHKIDELLEDRQFDPLLRELRSIPNPSDVKLSPNTVREGVESPSPDGSKKTLSTQQAVDLIRNLLLSAKIPQMDDGAVEVEEDEEVPEMLATSDSDMDIKTNDDVVIVEASQSNVIGGWESGEMDVEDELSDYHALPKTGGNVTANSSMSLVVVPAEDVSVVRSVGSENDDNDSSDNMNDYEDAATGNVAIVAMEDEEVEVRNAGVSGKKKNLSVIVSQDDSALYTRSGKVLDDSPTSTALAVKKVEEKRIVAAVSTPNGFQCAFPPHRVTAGCTAIVAFVCGSKLYVANAGDSRGVLCRENGSAHDLSFDHKPNGPIESSRIRKAGGFVNALGRVNGNLNLSRSLGDLKYKQLKHLPREDQVISGDPDITETAIEPNDKFFILACDGIWDCLTNQEACDFVTKRLDVGMDLTQIVQEMCHHCVADDPRTSQGIGGDNMTCLIVLLNQ